MIFLLHVPMDYLGRGQIRGQFYYHFTIVINDIPYLGGVGKWGIFKNGPSKAFLVYFQSFLTNNANFTAYKCDYYPTSSRYRDSNPWPLDHESPPITTWYLEPPMLCEV